MARARSVASRVRSGSYLWVRQYVIAARSPPNAAPTIVTAVDLVEVRGRSRAAPRRSRPRRPTAASAHCACSDGRSRISDDLDRRRTPRPRPRWPGGVSTATRRKVASGVSPAGRSARPCAYVGEALVHLGEHHVLLRGEVAEERARRHVGGGGDVGDRGLVVAALGEQAQGGARRWRGGCAASSAPSAPCDPFHQYIHSLRTLQALQLSTAVVLF